MRQLPGFQDGRDERRGVPLISHHVVPDAAHPGLEQLALRGFPGAIGSFERHQETAVLVLPAQEFAEPPVFRLIGALKGMSTPNIPYNRRGPDFSMINSPGGIAQERDQVILAIRQRRETVLQVIRSARERLLISVFRCTDVTVLDAIGEALNRKVDVRFLMTPRARGWEKRLKALSSYLESMGAKVHPYSDPVVKYHAKYLLADDGPALITSLNLTAKCFGATCDFILLTHDPGVVAGLRELFEVTGWRRIRRSPRTSVRA